MKLFLHSVTLSFLLVAGTVGAAPKQVEAIYQATRAGQPFATITETFKQENGRYKIESVTKGLGVYALLGKRVLTSEGEVTKDGLKPSHFELHQGDNTKKSLYADFDWEANQLNMKVKGSPVTAPLEKGTQDILSVVYQFMFVQPGSGKSSGDEFNLPVTTGKKLRSYTYHVAERSVLVDVPAGKYKAIHLINADKDKDADEKELWLGSEAHHLPIRLLMHDENGAVIEQTLTSLHAE